jgi:transcriptional regulator with XRE-family HTH domain
MKMLLDKIMYDKNLSIRQVSIMTGVPKSTINDIAVGKTMPRIDTLETIAKGLKIRISDLYESDYK